MHSRLFKRFSFCGEYLHYKVLKTEHQILGCSTKYHLPQTNRTKTSWQSSYNKLLVAQLIISLQCSAKSRHWKEWGGCRNFLSLWCAQKQPWPWGKKTTLNWDLKPPSSSGFGVRAQNCCFSFRQPKSSFMHPNPFFVGVRHRLTSGTSVKHFRLTSSLRKFHSFLGHFPIGHYYSSTASRKTEAKNVWGIR